MLQLHFRFTPQGGNQYTCLHSSQELCPLTDAQVHTTRSVCTLGCYSVVKRKDS